MKRQQERHVVKIESHCAASHETNLVFRTSKQEERFQNQLVWSKVCIAKAIEQNSNVTSRLGKVEELEKTLNLLDRFQLVIGEVEYMKRIECLAASMPNLDTYETDVEVIVINNDINDHDNSDDGCGRDTNDSIVDDNSNENLAPTAETTT